MKTSISFRKSLAQKLLSMKQSKRDNRIILMFSKKNLFLPRTSLERLFCLNMPTKNLILMMLNSTSMNLLECITITIYIIVYELI